MTRIATAIRYLAIINFVIFTIIANWIGGDALNGHVDAGRYFLSSHGQETEVSEATFQYSRIHAISTFTLLGLGALVTLMSKPSPTEMKWQWRIIIGFFAATILFYFCKSWA